MEGGVCSPRSERGSGSGVPAENAVPGGGWGERGVWQAPVGKLNLTAGAPLS